MLICWRIHEQVTQYTAVQAPSPAYEPKHSGLHPVHKCFARTAKHNTKNSPY